MPLGDATHLTGPLGGEAGCESCLVDGSVLAILIVTGAAEMSAGLCLGGFRFVWGFFWLVFFFFTEGKLTHVHSAHVTSCKLSRLHAPRLPHWCFPAVGRVAW